MSYKNELLRNFVININSTTERILSFEGKLAEKTIYSERDIYSFKECYKDLSDEKIEFVLRKLSGLGVNNIFQTINIKALLEDDLISAFPGKFQPISNDEIREMSRKLAKLSNPLRVFHKSARRETAQPKNFLKSKKHL
ncbi:hypothetical protein [Chryseobacterium vrystaatense]|uniref:Uncharacterized protein n=1 Tax=Chryseobacterium vrystaatense TaxID=307480 RepID=A0ABR4UP08_9FLAO|nr:hypothetical protein [Chryseobacterium vrystaatense]KFF26850.1 hypothetical protein IW16_06100 [Chryseobacterium vrystaatense]